MQPIPSALPIFPLSVSLGPVFARPRHLTISPYCKTPDSPYLFQFKRASLLFFSLWARRIIRPFWNHPRRVANQRFVRPRPARPRLTFLHSLSLRSGPLRTTLSDRVWYGLQQVQKGRFQLSANAPPASRAEPPTLTLWLVRLPGREGAQLIPLRCPAPGTRPTTW